MVALLELTKGVIAILASIALAFHHEIAKVFHHLALHLHLNPGRHHPGALLHAFQAHASTHIRIIALGVLLYASLRLLEGTGLWLGKRWAVWLGAVSGAFYLPFEIIEAIRKPTPLSVSTLLITIAITYILISRLPKMTTSR